MKLKITINTLGWGVNKILHQNCQVNVLQNFSPEGADSNEFGLFQTFVVETLLVYKSQFPFIPGRRMT